MEPSRHPFAFRSLAGLAVLATASALLPAAPVLAQSEAQRRAQANRDRCINGGLVGGALGGLVSRGSVLNRLGITALGATAGCVINRGVNEGR